MSECGKAVCFSAWDLESSVLTRHSGGVFTALTDHVLADNGLMYHIDEALRAKIECSLEDFTRVNEESHVFLDSVTDDLAPSYSCAVPLGMCFKKILRRLSHRKPVGDERVQSYYRTLDALLNDVGSILDNCMLYNSADSEIVMQGCRVIADAKALIEQLVSRHQKEQTAKGKADEERRRKIMLQYNATACVRSNPSITNLADSKNSKSRRSALSVEEQAMQGPFSVALNRSWMERTDRDSSWSAGTRVVRTSADTRTEWVPQSGDAVLYSRFLHAEFIKGHHESLLTDQCNLPQFVMQSVSATFGAMSPPAGQGAGNLATIATQAPFHRSNEVNHPGVTHNVSLPVGEAAIPLVTAALRNDRQVGEMRMHEASFSLPMPALAPLHMNPVSRSVAPSSVEGSYFSQPCVANHEELVRQAVLAHSIHSQFLVGRIVWVRCAEWIHPQSYQCYP